MSSASSLIAAPPPSLFFHPHLLLSFLPPRFRDEQHAYFQSNMPSDIIHFIASLRQKAAHVTTATATATSRTSSFPLLLCTHFSDYPLVQGQHLIHCSSVKNEFPLRHPNLEKIHSTSKRSQRKSVAQIRSVYPPDLEVSKVNPKCSK